MPPDEQLFGNFWVMVPVSRALFCRRKRGIPNNIFGKFRLNPFCLAKKGGDPLKKAAVLSLFLFLFCFFAGEVVAVARSIHWGLKRAENGIPPQAGKELDALLEKYGAFYKGSGQSKIIYLTFDNGYENGYTGEILDVLKKEKVPAAFFVTGHYLRSAPQLVKRMAEEGHIIGNHSWSHPDFTTLSDEEIRKELELVRKKVLELTGRKDMLFLRPPRGIFNERTLKVANEAGYIHVFWSLAYVDWNIHQQRGTDYAYRKIMEQIHPGAVLLLHSVSRDNARALESVIRNLKKAGYEFRTLNDLLLERQLGKQPFFY